MSKHTAGPWEAVEVGSFGFENPIAVCEVQTADGYETICESAWAKDARLIAAAPELLEALRDMLAVAEGTATLEQRSGVYPRAYAAIRKATGE